MPTVNGIDFDIQAFLLCDSVMRDVQTGKTAVQGIFDSVFAPSFPAIHAQMTAYFRFQFDAPPRPPIQLSLAVTNPAGLRNVSPGVPLNIQPNLTRNEGWINLQGLQFSQAGDYTFELLVNGLAVADYTLMVQQVGGTQASGSGRLLN